MKNETILKTKEILEKFSITQAPVPIEEIVAQYGISIGYAPSEDYSGVLIRKSDGGFLMGINSDETNSRMRFTIAHELAHFLFDKNKAVSIDYRNKTRLINKPEKEKRADFFAANLLMPDNLVTEDFKKASNNTSYFSEADLIKLAELYQVSKEAMRYRLQNLNLIPKETVEIPF